MSKFSLIIIGAIVGVTLSYPQPTTANPHPLEECLNAEQLKRNEGSRSWAMQEIALQFVATGDVSQALKIAQAIPHADNQEATWYNIALQLSQVGQFADALEVTQNLSALNQASILPRIAWELVSTDESEAIKLFAKAKKIAQTLEPQECQEVAMIAHDHGLAESAKRLATAGKLTQALQLTQMIVNKQNFAWTFSEIGTTLAENSQFEQARQLAQNLDEEGKAEC